MQEACMTLLERYLNYLSQICEGSRTPPEGILLTRTGDMEKAIELQQQIAGLGIPEFVKRCAAQDGEKIPEQELESFDASQMLSALTQMDAAGEALPAAGSACREKAQPEPVKTEIRDIYEVFLDSVCLEDNLLSYLIDILKRGAKDEFQTLSHAAARTLLRYGRDFCSGSAQRRPWPDPTSGRAQRLWTAVWPASCRKGKGSLPRHFSPAMRRPSSFSGPKRRSSCIFPDATYEWYVQNYLDRYYPCGSF